MNSFALDETARSITLCGCAKSRMAVPSATNSAFDTSSKSVRDPNVSLIKIECTRALTSGVTVSSG